MSERVIAVVINLFSSLMYDQASAGGKKVVGAVSERRMRKKLSKELQAKLSEFSSHDSIVFESDSFVDYLEHMQPVQRIYEYLDPASAKKESSWNVLLAQLCGETVQYLSERRQNVSVLEQKSIKKFYQTVYDICLEHLHSSLSPSDQKLALITGQKMENNTDQLLDAYGQSQEKLSRRIDQTGTNIVKQLCALWKMGNDRAAEPPRFTLAVDTHTGNLPYQCLNGSAKLGLIKQVSEGLRAQNWVHVYGKMFCGKTQGLLRVAERVGSFMWFDVQYDQGRFLQCRLDEGKLEPDMVVIMDGIPGIAEREVQEQCARLWECCHVHGCRLVTSGYEDVLPYMKKYIEKTKIRTVLLNGLEEQEVDEIMRAHHAPEDVFGKKWYHIFREVCGELPAVVMELICQLEEKGWVLDDDSFMTMISRRTDTESNQMIRLFLASVQDEAARRLYYRILYANHPVEASWIPGLAGIPQAVAEADQCISRLTNRWVYRDGSCYQYPNTMMNQYAEEQLTVEEKRAVDEYLADMLRQRALGPSDVTNLLMHYLRLDWADEAGMLCVFTMEHMMEQDVKEFFLAPETFWNAAPFPEKMSPFVKCMVRAVQIRVRLWKGEKFSSLRKYAQEMMALADESEQCGILVVVWGIQLATLDAEASIEILSYQQKHSAQTEKQYAQLQEHLPEDSVWRGHSLRVMYYQVLVLFVDSMDGLRRLADCLKQEAADILSEFAALSDIEAMVYCLLERVRKNECTDVDKYLEWMENLYDRLDEERFFYIRKGICRALLVAYSANGYFDKGVTFYHCLEASLMEDPLANIDLIDLGARFAYDNGDILLARQLFQIVVEHLSAAKIKEEGEGSVFIQSCLLYLSCLSCEDQDEIGRVKETLRDMAHGLPEEDAPGVEYKLLGEYYVRLYELGLLKDHMGEYIDYIEKVLREEQETPSVAVKAVLARITHVTGYIQQQYLFGHELSTFADGSTYAKPKQFMFWNDVEDAVLLPYWGEEKRRALYYLLSSLAQVYTNTEWADRLFSHIYEGGDYWDTSIEAFYYVDSYMQLTLLRLKEYEKLAYMMKCNYTEHDLTGMRRENRYCVIVREMFLYSLFILSSFWSDRKDAAEICRSLRALINVKEYAKLAGEYYTEYRKILGVVIEEKGDYDLMKEVMSRVRDRTDLTEMAAAVYPLVMLDAPASQRERYLNNLEKAAEHWHYDQDRLVRGILDGLSSCK